MTYPAAGEAGEAWEAADAARTAAAAATPAGRAGEPGGAQAGAGPAGSGAVTSGAATSGAAGPGSPQEAPGRRPITAADVEEALRDVIDPELGVNVVDLGLVYGVQLAADGGALVDMTLTTAACPLTDVIEQQAAAIAADLVPYLKINWVWMPPWGPDRITDDGREQLRAIGFNV